MGRSVGCICVNLVDLVHSHCAYKWHLWGTHYVTCGFCGALKIRTHCKKLSQMDNDSSHGGSEYLE